MNLLNIVPDIEQLWDEEILPVMEEFIKIPNKSPMFDQNWEKNGYMQQAVDLVVTWCKKQKIRDMKLKVLQESGRTPLIFIEIPGEIDQTVLLYGHVDKQPEMTGWDPDKGPWKPVRIGDKLYGRGAADDGYAVFAAIAAIATLQQHKIPHGRCVVLIEASEESASLDLNHYLKKLDKDLGVPDLVICLDSGCGNYETLWATTSLRGIVAADLHIDILKNGIHSGSGSGVVPGWFSVLSTLLARIENPKTHKIVLKELCVEIPKQHKKQAQVAAKLLGKSFLDDYPLLKKVSPLKKEIAELMLAKDWRPTLSITGISRVPAIENAGNVTLPGVIVKLSFRLPPTCSAKKAAGTIKKVLEKDPPYGVHVTCHAGDFAQGWMAPPLAPWLEKATEKASKALFKKKPGYMGEGGSIPFMGILGEKFPKAQFLITGVLGPKSNAHGPNEFLHVPLAKKVTSSIAMIVHEHYLWRKSKGK